MLTEYIPLFMFVVLLGCLLLGYPVAVTLGGTGLAFAALGIITNTFTASDLGFIPVRIFGTLTNQTFIAIPLFILMGVLLEKAHVADGLLQGLARLFSKVPGGMALAVIIVGTLMAASTGIVGATVVTIGMIALPSMLRAGYAPSLAAGTICATGTLGQIIPPSIALVLLGDVIANAYQQAQISQGIFNPKAISIGHLFAGALIPGLVLVLFYSIYTIVLAWFKPSLAPPVNQEMLATDNWKIVGKRLLAPLLLITAVPGSIIIGIATPTEAAGLGAIGAGVLALLSKQPLLKLLPAITQGALKTTGMVFFILIGVSIFSLVFRSFGGDELIRGFFSSLPGGILMATLIVMAIIFLLGFVLDFIEIIFIIVPIVGPVLLAMGLDPIVLGIMIAINVQTSFLTPPFGFALFYLHGFASDLVSSIQIYKGVIPFVIIQLVVLVILLIVPDLVTWLPEKMFD